MNLQSRKVIKISIISLVSNCITAISQIDELDSRNCNYLQEEKREKKKLIFFELEVHLVKEKREDFLDSFAAPLFLPCPHQCHLHNHQLVLSISELNPKSFLPLKWEVEIRRLKINFYGGVEIIQSLHLRSTKSEWEWEREWKNILNFHFHARSVKCVSEGEVVKSEKWLQVNNCK